MSATSAQFSINNLSGLPITLPYVEGDNPSIPVGGPHLRSYLLQTPRGGRHGLHDSPPDTADQAQGVPSSNLKLIGDMIDSGVLTMSPDPRSLGGADAAEAFTPQTGDVVLHGASLSGADLLLAGESFDGTPANNSIALPGGLTVQPDAATAIQLTISDWATVLKKKTVTALGSKIPGVQGTLLLDSTNANSDITCRERTPGQAPTVALVDPSGANQPLTVAVSGKAISVSLETDGGSAIVSTAAEVIAALNANAAATALISAEKAEGADTGVVEAIPAAPLTGGSAAGQPVTVFESGFASVTVDTVGTSPGLFLNPNTLS